MGRWIRRSSLWFCQTRVSTLEMGVWFRWTSVWFRKKVFLFIFKHHNNLVSVSCTKLKRSVLHLDKFHSCHCHLTNITCWLGLNISFSQYMIIIDSQFHCNKVWCITMGWWLWWTSLRFCKKVKNSQLNSIIFFEYFKCNKWHFSEARWENARLTPVGEVYQIIFF